MTGRSENQVTGTARRARNGGEGMGQADCWPLRWCLLLLPLVSGLSNPVTSVLAPVHLRDFLEGICPLSSGYSIKWCSVWL